MPGASYLQTSFLGGQWSPTAQGRADEEAYRTALNVSFNALPVEAGAHTRRPGTQAPSTTRKGLPGIVRDFHFSQANPYNLEFTDGKLRLWAGSGLVLEFPHQITSITTGNPAVINVPGVGTDWAAGDTIEMTLTPVPGTSPAGVAILFNRQFQLGTKSGTTFPLLDPVTGANINGATLNLTGWTITGAKVLEFTTPYVFGTAWKTTQLRVVQDQDTAFILVPGFAPATLANVGSETAPSFQWTAPGSVTFLDGPYLDPPTDGSTLTPSGVSGSITLTASAITSINNGNGFQSTDVGRFVRLFSEPLNWSSGTNYVAGNQVRFETGAGPAYYQAIVANHNVEPDTDNGTNWAIATTAAAWSWGIITAVADTSHCTVTIQGSRTDIYQQPLAGGSLLYTNPIAVWRLGTWSATTGYPTTGTFHEGRFWFAGAIDNRFETTMSQENFDFAPTLLDGTVADNNGISELIKSKYENTIFWFAPNAEGVVLGTQGGEWLLEASSLGEAITPTSINAKQVTRYGCANVEPRSAGLSWLFVQRYNKQVYEYLADVYSRKWSGVNIARRARNLTAPGVVELAYLFENAPVLWARTGNDQLIGCTYKRSSPFATQTPADFMGWHHHTLGSNRAVHSISAGPSPDGTVDALCMVTYDTVTGIHYVEFLTPVFEETALITQSWFLDGAITPTYAEIVGSNLILYGLNYLVGDTLTAWIGGLDAGDFTVSATGTLTIPIDGSANPLLTAAEIAALSAQGGFGNLGVNIVVTPPGQGWFSPVGSALGYTATSVSGNFNQGPTAAVFDWPNNRLYEQRAAVGGDPSTNGRTLFAFNLTTRAQVFQANPGAIAFDNAACPGVDGNIYTIDGSGGAHVRRFNVTSQTVDIDFTSATGGAGYCASMQTGGINFVFATGINSGTGGGSSSPWWFTNMTLGSPATLANTGFFDEQQPSLAGPNALPSFRGPPGAVYVVVNGQTGGAGQFQIGVYRATADSATNAGVGKVGVITPAAVHAGLTSITATSQPIYDETDGNLIIQTEGSDSVFRLIKVNTATGAVMWTLVNASNDDLSRSRIQGGSLSFVDSPSGSPYTLVKLNTLTGVADTSTTETAIGAATLQASNDLIGILVLSVSTTGATQWDTFGPNSSGGAITPAVIDTAPAVIGFNYISQGQILRPVLPQELLDQTGPGLGKTRRSHMYSALFVNTQGVKVGTNFASMRAANLVTAGRTQTLAKNVLFTDVIQATLEDTTSFHSMWAWQTDRPYPTTVASVEVFLHESPR